MLLKSLGDLAVEKLLHGKGKKSKEEEKKEKATIYRVESMQRQLLQYNCI